MSVEGFEPMDDVTSDPIADIAGPGAIWAQDVNGVIGDGPNMAWNVPGDFAHFKRTTWGGALLLGRLTFESLPGVLAGRDMVVVSRSSQVDRAHFDQRVAERGLDATLTVVTSLEEGWEVAQQRAAARGGRLWVSGGGQIYRACLERVQLCVVSQLDLEVAHSPHLVYAPSLEQGWERLAVSDQDWRTESDGLRWRVNYFARSC
ncbi:dihydrofolate reductase [Buchananella felis]|uniref:dihydrofolate reductase n=1 Tax=Buchananella felis TaxID=3231492 RepID=UPI0035296A00